jgi:GT2 family glycosyltransferase
MNPIPAEHPTVCCIILTFNRLSCLKECLNSVLAQTRPADSILVVDNASFAETKTYLHEESLRHPSLLVEHLPENIGPAGGYAFGLDWARHRDFSYCWVMDDDVFAQPDCLAGLLMDMDAADNKIVFPEAIRQGARQVYPAWAGVLIPVPAIKRAGLPMAELFWWAEDTEYLQWRLPKVFGVESVFSSRCRVSHGTPGGGEKPAWKYYYEIRNTIYYRIYVQKRNVFRRARRITRTLLRLTGRAILEKGSLKKLSLIATGALHGAQKELGKRIDPEKSDSGRRG